ncbi:MAG: hypothetical protein PHQ20_02240 [Candidatus Moranbacteria bacterium]|jgi:hypothetical protein|nr:hypothetical protein [Candidatus Moranbacteria bacterium]
MKTKKEIEQLSDLQLLRAFVSTIKRIASCETFGSDDDCLRVRKDYYLLEAVILDRLGDKRIIIYDGSQVAA